MSIKVVRQKFAVYNSFYISVSVSKNFSRRWFCQESPPSLQGKTYIVLDGGVRFAQENSEVESDPGYVFGGGIGYDTSAKARFELAFSYSSNEIDSVDGVSLSSLGLDAEINLFDVLAKAYFDFFSDGKKRGGGHHT